MEDPTIRCRILDRIRELEKERDVRILMACLAGGRAYGIAASTSDYDIRFVYAHPVEWYLSIEPSRKDTIVWQPDKDLDLNGWELKKALQLLRDSNISIIEWLRAPSLVVSDTLFVPAARALAESLNAPKTVVKHFLNMARKHFSLYLEGKERVVLKKYFYVLIPLCSVWFMQQHAHSLPPVNFADLLNALEWSESNAAAKDEILKLLDRKRESTSLGKGEKLAALDDFIAIRFAEAEKFVAGLPYPPDVPTDPFNKLMKDVLLCDFAKKQV